MKRIPLRLTVGVVLVVAGQSMILAHHAPISDFYFPVVWSGYVLTVDGLLDWFTESSLWKMAPAAMLWMIPVSAGFWWNFEACNLAVGSWHYVGAGSFPGASYYALASVSFTSVIPAVWVTAMWVDTFISPRLIHGRRRSPNIVHQFDLTTANAGKGPDSDAQAATRSGAGKRHAEERNASVERWMAVAFAAGIACVVLPLLFPRYAFGLIWGAVFLLIDPLNYALGRPSLIRQVIAGQFSTTASFALGGLVCGFFWEFWNYWSIIKWEYTVPFVSQLHLFEMPLPGYLGYLPFGLEVYAATMLVVPTLLVVRLPRCGSLPAGGAAGEGFDGRVVRTGDGEPVTAP